MLHRDIKPENILLSQGHALVTDFGIAKALISSGGAPAAHSTMTETGLVVGTAAYMSPEQASGERELDARTDIYSLGCVLYEMLVGGPPFTGTTAQAILVSRLTTDPPSARAARPELAVALESALARALARDPRARFASVAELANALGSAGERTDAPAAASLETRVSGAARRRYRTAVLGAAGLLLAVGAAFLAFRRPPPRLSGGPIPVAVLPFRSVGGTGQALPLSVGVPDAIMSRLAGVRQLRLRPTSAILRYADREVDVRAVGRELAVDYVLTDGAGCG